MSRKYIQTVILGSLALVILPTAGMSGSSEYYQGYLGFCVYRSNVPVKADQDTYTVSQGYGSQNMVSPEVSHHEIPALKRSPDIPKKPGHTLDTIKVTHKGLNCSKPFYYYAPDYYTEYAKSREYLISWSGPPNIEKNLGSRMNIAITNNRDDKPDSIAFTVAYSKSTTFDSTMGVYKVASGPVRESSGIPFDPNILQLSTTKAISGNYKIYCPYGRCGSDAVEKEPRTTWVIWAPNKDLPYPSKPSQKQQSQT